MLVAGGGEGSKLCGRIALLTGMLSSAAGGLAVSVPALAWGLAKRGNVVHVVGLGDQADADAAVNWGPSVHSHRISPFLRFGDSSSMLGALHRIAPQVIDVQGIWHYPSLVNLRHHCRTGTPFVVTPRGMLDPWALARSSWKKRLVRLWFEDEHLSRAACLRATSELEATHIRSFGLRNPIAIVPNGIDVPEVLLIRPVDVRRRLLFLSRVHPKKGISHLLQAWSAIEMDRPDWELVIAGPDEVGHVAEMRAMAKRLRIKRIRWHGAVHGEIKSALYRSADLLVLPTHAENFGLVVAEALAHEVPVITTRHAPWEGLANHQCGWWIDLDVVRLREALLEATSLPREALWAMGARGRIWMTQKFSWVRVAEEMNEVYDWVINGGSPPSTIILD